MELGVLSNNGVQVAQVDNVPDPNFTVIISAYNTSD